MNEKNRSDQSSRAMSDHELERRARNIGARAEQQLDVSRVVARVGERLRTDEQLKPEVHRPGLGMRGVRRVVQLAAVLAVLVTGALFVRRASLPVELPAEFAVPLALEDLSEAELTDVLDSLEFAGPVGQAVTGGIDDLSESELRALLATME